MARKPRDIAAELKALQDKAKTLKAKRLVQFGELIVATGADALDAETLAGALVAAVEGAKQPETKEGWRRRGATFFQSRARRGKGAGQPQGDGAGDAENGAGRGEG